MVEDELISGLKRGDATAFRHAVDRYQVAVLNCCFRFVRNRETAEDLTQDVFLEVHRSIGSFRSNAKFSTWLLRIAISKSLDHLKHMKRQKRMGFLKSLLAREELIDSAIASDTPGPDQMLENEERKRVL
jgi:RNA polymerase sigma-70 factor (ECF subfamily)